jgi:hypothetical protein
LGLSAAVSWVASLERKMAASMVCARAVTKADWMVLCEVAARVACLGNAVAVE